MLEHATQHIQGSTWPWVMVLEARQVTSLFRQATDIGEVICQQEGLIERE